MTRRVGRRSHSSRLTYRADTPPAPSNRSGDGHPARRIRIEDLLPRSPLFLIVVRNSGAPRESPLWSLMRLGLAYHEKPPTGLLHRGAHRPSITRFRPSTRSRSTCGIPTATCTVIESETDITKLDDGLPYTLFLKLGRTSHPACAGGLPTKMET